MAISAGNIIDNADFTPRFKISSTVSGIVSVAAGKEGNLKYNFIAPTDYPTWVGLIACTLSNNNFVIRSFSDTLVVVKNLGSATASCSATWVALYTNWGTGTCVASTANVSAGNIAYANAIAPIWYRLYKEGPAYSTTSSTNINPISTDFWPSGPPAGMSPAAILTCTTGHSSTLLRGWTGDGTGSSIAMYARAFNTTSGTPALTRLFLKTAMKGSAAGTITGISEYDKIYATNCGSLWITKEYTFSYSNLSSGGTLSRTATNLSLSTPSGYKAVAMAKIYTDNSHGLLQAFNPLATGSEVAIAFRNSHSSAISGTLVIFKVLYLSTNLIA